MRQAVLTLLLLASAHAAMAAPCWITVQAGIDDNFNLPSDQDPANLTPELMFAVGQNDPSYFVGFNADHTQVNRFFGHSFQLNPTPYNYLNGALRLHLRPLYDIPGNDTLLLWADPSGDSWAVNLTDLGYTISPFQEIIVDLDLSTLLTQSGTPLLAHISQYSVLHVFLQDDTSVDDMTLYLDWCPPPPPTPLVGVIKGPEGCGSMPEYDVFFDNEDSRNANNRGGWIGATESGGNTLLRLCGVDGTNFELAAAGGARFAVVALANTCPAGFTRFDRYHDNEDNRPAAWDSAPSGSPTDTVGSAKNTNMAFCVATGSNTGVANSAFPNLGVSYGVFGGRTSSLSSWALDRGYIFLDDQDGGNQNQPGSPPAYTWEFLEAGGNTTYYMARVK